MRTIVEFFVKRRLLVNLIVVIVFLAGIFTLSTLERQGYPNVDMGELVITTIYPGASPHDVELNVSIPIEDELQEISGIKEIISVSSEGKSTLEITLHDDLTDDEADDAKREIQKAIDRVADFPEEVTEKPAIAEIEMSMIPVIEIALQGNDRTKLRTYSKRLKRKIERIKGISYISRIGFRNQEVKIEVNPHKLQSTETAISDVVNAIKARNVRMSGGNIDSFVNERNIVTLEEFNNIAEVRNVIIRSNFSGKALRVKDIAKVSQGYEKQDLIVRSNGKSSISLCIHKKEREDIIRVVDRLNAFLKKEKMPAGISYQIVNDTSYYTRNRLQIVLNNALMGIILVFAVLLTFLNLRTAFWTAFGIPFSFMLAMMFLPHFDISINVISLAGFILVLGMLVDDAIVVAENIQRHHEEGEQGMEATINGVMEIIMPVATTITTTMIAFAPMLIMSGIMGKFVWALPVVVVLSLAASFLESIFILPCHLTHAGETKNNKPKQKKKITLLLESFYKERLRIILNKRYIFLGIAGLVLVLSLGYAFKNVPFLLMPKSGIKAFFVRLYAPRGTSLEKMVQLVEPYEKIIQKLPKNEVESFASRIGYDTPYYWRDRGDHDNEAIIYVYLTAIKYRKRYADAILADLKEQVKHLDKKFDRVIYEIENPGPPVGKPITVRVKSDNDQQRIIVAEKIKNYLKTIKGVSDVDDDNKLGKDELKINIKYNKLAQLGLTVRDVAMTLRTAYNGTKVTSVRDKDEDVEYRVQLEKKYRQDASYVLKLPIRNFQGRLVPLKRVASLSVQESASDIHRYDRMRTLTVTGEVDNKNINALRAMQKTQKHFKTIQDEYPDIILEYSGEGQETEDSIKNLVKTFLLAVIGIYFMLVLLFNSFLQPIFVMSAIPYSAVGVILAFALHGASFTFAAIMGFVGLAGVVVNDSLIMVSYINKLHRENETDQDYFSAIMKGAVTRLRPIILTSVTTISGVMPIIYGWGGVDSFIIPMAMTLGYGLLGATILTLFIIPCLLMVHRDYLHFANEKLKPFFLKPFKKFRKQSV